VANEKLIVEIQVDDRKFRQQYKRAYDDAGKYRQKSDESYDKWRAQEAKKAEREKRAQWAKEARDRVQEEKRSANERIKEVNRVARERMKREQAADKQSRQELKENDRQARLAADKQSRQELKEKDRQARLALKGAAAQRAASQERWRKAGLTTAAMGAAIAGGITGFLTAGAITSYGRLKEFRKAHLDTAGIGPAVELPKGRKVNRASLAAWQASRVAGELGFSQIDVMREIPGMGRATGTLDPSALLAARRARAMSSAEVLDSFGAIRAGGSSFRGGFKSAGVNEFQRIMGGGVKMGLEQARFPDFARNVSALMRRQFDRTYRTVDARQAAEGMTMFSHTGLSAFKDPNRSAAAFAELQSGLQQPGGGDQGLTETLIALGAREKGYLKARMAMERGAPEDILKVLNFFKRHYGAGEAVERTAVGFNITRRQAMDLMTQGVSGNAAKDIARMRQMPGGPGLMKEAKAGMAGVDPIEAQLVNIELKGGMAIRGIVDWWRRAAKKTSTAFLKGVRSALTPDASIAAGHAADQLAELRSRGFPSGTPAQVRAEVNKRERERRRLQAIVNKKREPTLKEKAAAGDPEAMLLMQVVGGAYLAGAQTMGEDKAKKAKDGALHAMISRIQQQVAAGITRPLSTAQAQVLGPQIEKLAAAILSGQEKLSNAIRQLLEQVRQNSESTKDAVRRKGRRQ
jgi:hypothetical protein